MKVSLMVAAALRGEIGKDNRLLWHLPKDLRRFKQLTLGKPIIMGRKTFEAIGKPLPGRTSIVVTRSNDLSHTGILAAASMEAALRIALQLGAEEAVVIGGGEIYRLAMPYVSVIYLTRVHTETDADTWFQMPAPEEWIETGREWHGPDEKHAFPFEFIDLRRNVPAAAVPDL